VCGLDVYNIYQSRCCAWVDEKLTSYIDRNDMDGETILDIALSPHLNDVLVILSQ
jgi:hypothetical protein